jgi:hypothetical protein
MSPIFKTGRISRCFFFLQFRTHVCSRYFIWNQLAGFHESLQCIWVIYIILRKVVINAVFFLILEVSASQEVPNTIILCPVLASPIVRQAHDCLDLMVLKYEQNNVILNARVYCDITAESRKSRTREDIRC